MFRIHFLFTFRGGVFSFDLNIFLGLIKIYEVLSTYLVGGGFVYLLSSRNVDLLFVVALGLQNA
jgi:hypothetical protein